MSRRGGPLPRAGARMGSRGRPGMGADGTGTLRGRPPGGLRGPWASKLVPELGGLPSRSGRCSPGSSRPDPSYFRLGAFPVFNLEVEEGRYYGFPSFLIPGFKFGSITIGASRWIPTR